MILVDTNVLLRSAQPGHVHYQAAVDALARLRGTDERLVVAPQSLYEMYVVCTRPVAQNGLGLSPQDGLREITQVRGLFDVLEETPASRATSSLVATLLTSPHTLPALGGQPAA